MANRLMPVLITLSLFGCKRAREPGVQVEATPPGRALPHDAGVAGHELAWYRASAHAPDGVEALFFLGVPAPGSPGQAVLKVGEYEVRSEATFDGKTLKISFPVYPTAVEATVGPDGSLAGSFKAFSRAWGVSSVVLTATRVVAPTPSTLRTVDSTAAVLDVGEPRSVWRIAMESGPGKLVLDQTAPGEFSGRLLLDTGNRMYVAGNGRGNTLVLTGFDGNSCYRIELELDADRAHARGKLFGGQRFDWREGLTATRGADFTLAIKPRPKHKDAKIELPASPELAALPRGPLVVEMAGSWCSTCASAAPFLVEFYREFQPRGLHMITLLYEFSDDRAADIKQAELFKQAYGVTWPVVPIQGSFEDFPEIMPSDLADIDPTGFPITLFLAADRSLVALHAGFPAADATDDLRRVKAEFRATVETLLAPPKGAGR